VRLGISSCLLGERVRWNGGHKQDDWIVRRLARWVELVPVCPEIEVGMGVPREPVRLEAEGREIRMIAVRTRKDWTMAMRRYVRSRIRQLETLRLAGYVLKKDSPSCGMARVPVHRLEEASRPGSGLFAAELMRQMPSLPIEEEGRLRDPRRREHFIERVFAHARLLKLMESQRRPDDLVAFHRDHELLLLSHSPRHARELSRLVAAAPRPPSTAIVARYGEGFMAALRIRPSVSRHCAALRHAAGLFEDYLEPEEKREIEKALASYRQRRVPRCVPLALLRRYLGRHRIPILRRQFYLHPYPNGLLKFS
jgi:uncharacterized protein YbbK (DUF523 family)/uncharacterized protein YbgA (DUF1722 family)